ncbi:MAG: hypothetical protein CBC82_07275 [Cellvibrionales bacterium TMED122]|nr:MAG: hypothetical protein CBC82_07275 [Cellvibrionales bacterium TMED122]|tara:strand:- start:4423 stop:5946 length:1524 start_codon:yes stop_codon:yes gene_type:complete
MNKKIIPNIKEASFKIKALKKKNKKIIHCHGVFDVIHLGHINHFKKAKSLGDILIVTVTADEFVNKGPNRPIFPLDIRMELLANLEFIDLVCPNHSQSAVPAINKLKSDIYCKGKDYKNNSSDISGQIKLEKKAVNSFGGKIFYTDDEILSSSKIINRSGLKLNIAQKNYLDLVTKKIKNKSDIFNMIESYKNLKVLVIGESIIDEYTKSEALGKSGKEPILVLRDLSSNKFLGGALAISNNVASLSNNVSLLSYIGEKKEFLPFIKKKLNKKIVTNFIFKKNAKTILKKRFIDHVNNQKVFGVYSIDDQNLSRSEEKIFQSKLKKKIKQHDIVIVSDYGHGLISKKTAKIIIQNSKFVAVNAQLNAANIGHHTISMYKNADLVIINENEMRHELRNKVDDIDMLIKDLSKKLNSKHTVVTSGSEGAKVFNKNNIVKCPAFGTKVIDKVGTGDSMLIILALSLYEKNNIYFSMLLASLAAAQNVQFMANSKSINRLSLIKSIQSYLK